VSVCAGVLGGCGSVRVTRVRVCVGLSVWMCVDVCPCPVSLCVSLSAVNQIFRSLSELVSSELNNRDLHKNSFKYIDNLKWLILGTCVCLLCVVCCVFLVNFRNGCLVCVCCVSVCLLCVS